MKKSYLVFSDIHGDRLSLEKLKAIAKNHDGVFFAGDGLSGLKDFTDKEIYAVGGNCHFGGAPEMIVKIDGVKILLTHGHKYSVKSSLLSLTLRAREQGCDVAIFGHTHDSLCGYENGVLLLNPGVSSGYGRKTFAILYIENGKVDVDIHTI